jgi:uncharacterized protein YdeI (YjbR/CyaY-like superfamily)
MLRDTTTVHTSDDARSATNPHDGTLDVRSDGAGGAPQMTRTVLAPANAAEWRAWLAKRSGSEREVWLAVHRGRGTVGLDYNAAIEQALCFGWIDSHARKGDGNTSLLRFTPRSPTSSWSRLNRDRADRMVATGQMTAGGQAAVDRARTTGRWRVPGEDGEPLPADLQTRLDRDDVARDHFERFPPSSRRLILVWIASARRPETRLRRVDRAVALAAIGIPANHPTHRPPPTAH